MADHTWQEGAGPVGDDPVEVELLGGRYQLVGLVGRGGMGAVYRAHDTWLDEVVAIKLIRSGAEPAVAARLRPALVREVKLARRVSHPGVVRVHDLGRHGDQLFLVMEYVASRSLADDLADHGPLSVGAALDVGRAVVEAMRAAHAAGVVHNDLKPDNVLLGDDGRVRLADFGIARAVGEARAREGTPAYMAPEQREVGRVDPRTDLYAFGRLFLAMLQGATPPRDVLEPDLAQVGALPERLSSALRACLFPVAGLRVASFDELASLLSFDVPRTADPRRPAPLRPADAVVLAVRCGEEPLAAGFAAEVVEVLGAVRGLSVRLDAAAEGSPTATLEVGQRVRLVDADGVLLWADSEPAGEVDEERAAGVAAAVASALGRSLPEFTRARAGSESYALYLRARHALRHGWTADVSRAVGLLEAAAARSPEDPRVEATLALARVRSAFFDRAGAPPRLPGLRDAAERVWRRAPDRVDAWDALARAELYLGDSAAAAAVVRMAADRFPGSSSFRFLLATLLVECGEVEGALEHFDQARWLDPDAEGVVPELAYCLALLGRRDEADQLLHTPVRGHSARPLERLRFAVWDGRVDVALPDVDHQPQVKAFATHSLSVLRHRSADAETSRHLFAPLLGSACPRFQASYGQRLTETFARAGLVGLAADVLERVAADGVLGDVAWLDRCPALSELRGTPRFEAARGVVAARAAVVRRVLGR